GPGPRGINFRVPARWRWADDDRANTQHLPGDVVEQVPEVSEAEHPCPPVRRTSGAAAPIVPAGGTTIGVPRGMRSWLLARVGRRVGSHSSQCSPLSGG